MKVKLLKKVRKKYGWYFNSDNDPVVLNHKTKRLQVYNLAYCMADSGYDDKKLKARVKIDYKVWALRIAKRDILSEFGYSLEKTWYKAAQRKLNRKLKKSTI